MRKPLIAGNWKMNLNHLEAIAVTQKLSYSLEDKDFDAVDVCVVGHSERRAIHKESDALVNKKIKAALANELTPIFCIGEELEIREAGTHVEHVLNQVRNGLAGFHKPELKKIVFAYEPVWAIGTGKTATPEDAQEVCSAIRVELAKIGSDEIAEAAKILYGGSVKSSNIVEIMKQADVDGALVGGASLDPEEFARICKFHRVA